MLENKSKKTRKRQNCFYYFSLNSLTFFKFLSSFYRLRYMSLKGPLFASHFSGRLTGPTYWLSTSSTLLYHTAGRATCRVWFWSFQEKNLLFSRLLSSKKQRLAISLSLVSAKLAARTIETSVSCTIFTTGLRHYRFMCFIT